MSQVKMCRFAVVEGNHRGRTQIKGVYRSSGEGLFIVIVGKEGNDFFSKKNLLEVPEEFSFWFST